MLLHFTLDEYGFRCEDAPLISNASTINYIKCHFDFHDDAWESVDAIVAIFKSATYNTVAEVLLDSNNDCFIEPEVYKRGGNIQVKLIGDKYINDSVHSTTHISAIAEFYIKENVIIPTPTPSKYDVFVAELEIAQQAVNDAIVDIYQKAADGEFDGADGVGIVSVSYNADGTVNVTLTDGTTFTSEYSMKGVKGDTGAAGVGISNVIYGQDGTLTITMSDGTIYTSEYSMKGPKGDQGNTGETGEKGDTGDDGFSPIATVSKSGDTATISITDANGTTTATVSDGAKGDKGDTGNTGATGNGIASITKTGTQGLVDTYTITFTNGTTTTFTVTNGANGSGSVADVWVDGTSVLDGDTAKIDLTGKADAVHTHTKSQITDFPTLASVATSGSYNDLSNKPTIPTVNNATLTIQKNGTTVNTFSANASSDVTANITVPTKVSDLTNDSGFITGYTETDPVFLASAAHGISSSDISSWNGKQAALVSGTNIKTVTGTSILGSGDLLPSAVGYTTTVPSAANTDGLKFVLCDSEPSTKYDGWVYLIKES